MKKKSRRGEGNKKGYQLVREVAQHAKGPATSPDDPSQSLGPIEKERTETHKLSSDFHTCTVVCMNHTTRYTHMPRVNRVQNREIIHNQRKHTLWKLDRKQCVARWDGSRRDVRVWSPDEQDSKRPGRKCTQLLLIVQSEGGESYVIFLLSWVIYAITHRHKYYRINN